MKHKSLKKKLSATLLATAMTISTLPQFTTPVLAVDIANELPDSTQFATMEQLKSFNTDDSNDGTKNPAKVYFGNNSQQWWIAGSQQENGLTLFAASPLATNQQFEPTYIQNKQYSADWECDYTSTGGSNPSDVNANHYGASPLRTTLQGLETSYFTGAEQGLMKETTIYTNDTKNSSVYSTTDKLYLPYGEETSNSITVGTNSRDSLNNGLRIDMDYWNSDFWLRAPCVELRRCALAAWPGDSVKPSNVGDAYKLVPAFELNLSSVIFASAALSATNVTASGTLEVRIVNDKDIDGAFTLRYDASKHSKNLGSALVSYDKSKVILTDVPTNTYLVVQNKDGAKAKQITSETEVIASDLNLDSFENCKVWLETTDTADRMTYATLAEEEQPVAEVDGIPYLTLEDAYSNCQSGDTIKILKDFDLNEQIEFEKNIILNLNNHTITVNSNYGIFIEKDCHMTIITGEHGDVFDSENTPYALLNYYGYLTVNGAITGELVNYGTITNGVFKEYVGNHGTIENGYYFDASLSSGSIVKGGYFKERPFINYAVYDDYKFTTTNDTEFPYKVCPKDDVIGLNISLSENLSPKYNYLLTQYFEKTNNSKKIEDITIYINSDYYLPENYFEDLDKIEGLEYKRNNNGFVISGVLLEDTTIVFDKPSLKLNGNDVIGNPTVSNVGYKERLTLKDVALPTGWEWANPNVLLTMGEHKYQAIYDTTDIEYSTKLDDVDGYDPMTHKVTREIPFTVEKGTTEITITTPSLDKEYDGKVVENPTYTVSGSNQEVIMTWQQQSSTTRANWIDLAKAPIEAGKYRVVLTVGESDNFESATKTLEFTIKKNASNDWEEELTIHDITYGETLNPQAKATYGTVTYAYSNQGNGTYTTTVPTNAGIYYVKASVEETQNYNGLESKPVKFEIKKLPIVEELEDIVKDSESKYDKNDYTEESYQDYLDALEKAESVLNDKNVTSEDIKEALDNLKAAIDGLKEKEAIVPNVDKSKLEEALDEYQDIDSDRYSKEAYEAFKKAYEKAQAILNDPNATKEDVASALSALEAAYKALEKESSTVPETGDSNNIYLYTTVMVMSGFALMIAIYKQKKALLKK